jgi:hypothetical protein
MTVVYPLTLPNGGAGIHTVRIHAVNVNAATESPFTFQSQIAAGKASRWEIDIKLKKMQREEAETWIAWLIALRGRFGTFLAGDPEARAPLGVATGGIPRLNGAATPGTRTISTRNWTTNVQGILKAGDYFQVADRLYKLLQDGISDGSGNATFDIFPPVREAHTGGSPLTLVKPAGLFRLAVDDASWESDDLRHFGLSFAAVEAL